MNKVFVGYDTREDISFQVCEHSILRHDNGLAPDVEVTPLNQGDLRKRNFYWRDVDKLASTEFTFTRFLVPALMNYKGWALFCDSDIVFLNSVKELFDLADDKYAVMCVQHEHNPQVGMKMDGRQQLQYPRKNWSSVVLWNCGHPSNQKITVDLINDPETTGKYLHRFAWLKDEEIGSLPHEWNWLVGWYREPEDGKPKALHYTEGGPWFKNYRDCEYNQIWKDLLTETMQGK
jgi:lipopolysaccharide biosynthesis glycosyltransferase